MIQEAFISNRATSGSEGVILSRKVFYRSEKIVIRYFRPTN